MIQSKLIPPADPQIQKYFQFLMDQKTVPLPKTEPEPSSNTHKYIFVHDEKLLVDEILMLTNPNIFVQQLLDDIDNRVFVALHNQKIDQQIFLSTLADIKQELSLDILLVKDAFEFTKITQQSSNIVLICPPQIIKNIERLAYKTQIKSIICYPAQIDQDYDWISNKFTQASSQIELKDIMINNQQQINTDYKTLPNFLVLPLQTFQSKTLLLSLQFCVKQTNERTRALLIDQFQQLIHKLIEVNQQIRVKKQTIQQFLYELRQGHLSMQRAIFWYTSDSLIYKLINNVLRCSKSTLDMLFVQPYLYDLFAAIKNCMFQNKLQNKKKGIKHINKMCYRGGQIQQTQILKFVNSIGKKVQNLGFLSTSCNQIIARGFIKNVFFEINLVQSNSIMTSYAQIKKVSQYSAEQQILFNPLNQFIVKQVEKVYENKKIIYQIKLQLYNDKDNVSFILLPEISLLSLNNKQVDLIFSKLSQNKSNKHMQDIQLYNQICRKADLSGTIKDKIISNFYNARLLCQKQQIAEFTSLFQESIELFELLQGSFNYKQQMLNLAVQIFFNAERYTKIEEIIKYIEEKKYTKNRHLNKILSKAYFCLKKYRQGIDLLNEILQQLNNQIKNQKDFSQKIKLTLQRKQLYQYYQMILVQLENQKAPKNIDESEQVFQVFEQDIQTYANKLQRIALVYQKQHKFDKAAQVYQKMLKQFLNYQNLIFDLIFRAFILLSNAFVQKRSFHQSLHCLKDQLLPIVIKFEGKNSWNYCMTLCKIADCYFQMDQQIKSKQFYNKFFQSVELGSYNFRKYQQISVLNMVGQAYSRVGNLDQAIQFHKKSQQLYQYFKFQDISCYSVNVINLTSCYARQGNLTEALKYLQKFDKVLKQLSECRLTGEYIDTVKDCARLFSQMNRHAKSIQYYKYSIQLLKKYSIDHIEQITPELTYLANAYYQNHQLNEAIQCYLRIFNMLKSFDCAYELCYSTGALYFVVGDYRESAFYYSKSVQMMVKQKGNKYPLITNSVLKVAENYVNLGHFQGVVYLLRVAAHLVNQNCKRISPCLKKQTTKKILKLFNRVQQSKIDRTEGISYFDL